MPVNQLITADEFLLLPDAPNGAKQELVRGEVITMPGPGGLHGVTCNKVGRRIGNFVDERGLGWVMANDTGFLTQRGPDTVRGPDVAFWNKQRLPEVPVGYIQIAPDLAVEVLSPSNTSKQIREKIEEYFVCGVPMVWVVAPEDRTVTVYRAPHQGLLLHDQKGAVVSGDEVLPGFECRVADLLP
jgi:Uma2 family endonuclease